MTVGIDETRHHDMTVKKILMARHVTTEQFRAWPHVHNAAISDGNDLVVEHLAAILHGQHPAGMQQGVRVQEQFG
jgi:hypothetical protein